MTVRASITPASRRRNWLIVPILAVLAVLPLRAGAQCAGDCNGDGSVVINELVLGVNIALGNQPVTACAAFDVNGNGQVTINELIAAVNNALGSCPVGGTPTATPTGGSPVATPTSTSTVTTPTLTPTLTQDTPTPTATFDTPTVTPTVGGVCGNGIVETAVGETCDDHNTIDNDGCPANCHVAVCTASDQRLRIAVSFATDNPDVFLQGLTTFLRYPDGTLSIPARDDSPPVLARVTSDIFAVTPRDFDYALRVLLLDPLLIGYNEGVAMTVEFDVCQGATSPPPSAVVCTIESATDVEFNDVPVGDVQCTLSAVL